MTAIEAILAVRFAGGKIAIDGSGLRCQAPTGSLGEKVITALREQRAEVTELLRVSRYDEVSQRIAAAYDRLDHHAPWQPEELASTHDLAEAMDLEAKRYMAGGSAHPAAFLEALARWELALVGLR